VAFQPRTDQQDQVQGDLLMFQIGRRRHVVLSVDQLVPLPVVGEQHELVVGELHAGVWRQIVGPRHELHYTRYGAAILSVMRSRSADAVARRRAERVAAMTPDDRMALAAHLGEESIAVYAAAHDLDRAAALVRVKATRRLGRRRSASAEAE
jgi:hypothetical protein